MLMCMAQSKEAVNLFADEISEIESKISKCRSEDDPAFEVAFEPSEVLPPPSKKTIFSVLRGGKA